MTDETQGPKLKLANELREFMKGCGPFPWTLVQTGTSYNLSFILHLVNNLPTILRALEIIPGMLEVYRDQRNKLIDENDALLTLLREVAELGDTLGPDLWDKIRKMVP